MSSPLLASLRTAQIRRLQGTILDPLAGLDILMLVICLFLLQGVMHWEHAVIPVALLIGTTIGVVLGTICPRSPAFARLGTIGRHARPGSYARWVDDTYIALRGRFTPILASLTIIAAILLYPTFPPNPVLPPPGDRSRDAFVGMTALTAVAMFVYAQLISLLSAVVRLELILRSPPQESSFPIENADLSAVLKRAAIIAKIAWQHPSEKGESIAGGRENSSAIPELSVEDAIERATRYFFAQDARVRTGGVNVTELVVQNAVAGVLKIVAAHLSHQRLLPKHKWHDPEEAAEAIRDWETTPGLLAMDVANILESAAESPEANRSG